MVFYYPHDRHCRSKLLTIKLIDRLTRGRTDGKTMHDSKEHFEARPSINLPIKVIVSNPPADKQDINPSSFLARRASTIRALCVPTLEEWEYSSSRSCEF